MSVQTLIESAWISLYEESPAVSLVPGVNLLILSVWKADMQSGQWPESQTSALREDASFGKLTVEPEGLTRHRQTPIFQNLILSVCSKEQKYQWLQDVGKTFKKFKKKEALSNFS